MKTEQKGVRHLFAPILLFNTKKVGHPYVLVQPEKQARTKKALEGIKIIDGCRCVLMHLKPRLPGIEELPLGALLSCVTQCHHNLGHGHRMCALCSAYDTITSYNANKGFLKHLESDSRPGYVFFAHTMFLDLAGHNNFIRENKDFSFPSLFLSI